MSGHGGRRLVGLLAAFAIAALVLTGSAAAVFIEESGSAYDLFGNGPYHVVTGDFNADGRVDVVTINGDSNNASVLLRREGAGFDREANSPFAFGMGAVGGNYGTVADFNRDGRPDIAAGFNSGHVSVLLRNAGNGFAAEGPTVSVGAGVSGVTAGDFDADGWTDVAASLYGGNVAILVRNPAGGFSAAVIVPTTGTQPRYVEAADVNGDGDPDLTIVNENSNDVAVMLGGPGATFTSAGPNVSVGMRPFGVVVRDFDANGLPDFAVANCTSDNVSVMLRQAGGGWAPAPGSPVGVGDCPVGLVAADFNFDGLPDFAAGNQGSSNVSVLINAGGAAFKPDDGSPVRTEQGATALASGDFDADKRPDLAVTNIGAQRVTILVNRTPFPPGAQPPNLDADGDGVQTPADCDDADASIRPGAKDKPGDNIDQDCSGRDARFRVIARSIAAFSLTYPAGYTRFTSMSVKPVRAGDRLKLTCKGRGCKRTSKTIRVTKNVRKLSLLKHLRRAHLKKGAVVRLRVTRPETIGRVNTWKIRAPKAPKLVRRCVRPGAKKTSRCPG